MVVERGQLGIRWLLMKMDSAGRNRSLPSSRNSSGACLLSNATLLIGRSDESAMHVTLTATFAAWYVPAPLASWAAVPTSSISTKALAPLCFVLISLPCKSTRSLLVGAGLVLLSTPCIPRHLGT